MGKKAFMKSTVWLQWYCCPCVPSLLCPRYFMHAPGTSLTNMENHIECVPGCDSLRSVMDTA